MVFSPQLIEAIQSAKQILITSHIHPDGDAAGSAIGLARSLRKAEKHVDIAWSTNVSGRFDFLFDTETILTPEAVAARSQNDAENPVHSGYDAVIILDVGSEDRTGFQTIIRGLGCPVINIDHHATNDGFADFDHVDTGASSTCEVIYYLIRDAGWPLDTHVAEALYTGLVTDSRHFQNAGVSASTFAAAAGLKSTGLKTEPIIRALVQNRTETDLRVLGLALSRFESRMDGRIAMTVLRQSDLKPLGATHRHAWSAGVFGYLISMASAMVSASFIEAEDGRVFCEFRSKNGFDVSGIATEFGGGGHRAAAGCSQEIPVDAFRDAVIERLEPMVAAFSSVS